MIGVVAAVSAGVAVASAPAAPPRSISGRRFLLSDRVPHPFVVRAVTFRQGAALVRVPDVVVPFEGQAAEDLLLVAAVERLGVAVPLTRRTGLVANLNGEVAAGANGASALLGGARVGFDWEAGATVVVAEPRDLRISVNPRLYGAQGVQVVPMAVVANAFSVAAGASDADVGAAEARLRDVTAGLVTPVRSVGGGIAVAGAWRISGRVGLLGGIRARTGFARAAGETGVPLSLGAGAGLDARLAEDSPLVGRVEYRYRNLRDAGADSETPLDAHVESRHHVGTGLFWRGRHESELGLSVWTLLREARVDEQLLGGEAVLRVFL